MLSEILNATQKRRDAGDKLVVTYHIIFVFVKSFKKQLQILFNRVHILSLQENSQIIQI